MHLYEITETWEGLQGKNLQMPWLRDKKQNRRFQNLESQLNKMLRE